MKKKNKERKDRHSLHEELKGFNIELNAFGQIESNLKVERLNEFLNKHLPDRKFQDENLTEKEEE
jgi:hypothetical protein